MSLQALLDELYKKLLEIPVVQEKEVIEPEHHNLLREAIELITQILEQLTLAPSKFTWPIVWDIYHYQHGGPYPDALWLFAPYVSANRRFYAAQVPTDAAGLKLPVAGTAKNLRIFISSFEANESATISVRKNYGEAAISITIPPNTFGAWFENTTDTLQFEEGDAIDLLLDFRNVSADYNLIEGWAYITYESQ